MQVEFLFQPNPKALLNFTGINKNWEFRSTGPLVQCTGRYIWAPCAAREHWGVGGEEEAEDKLSTACDSTKSNLLSSAVFQDANRK